MDDDQIENDSHGEENEERRGEKLSHKRVRAAAHLLAHVTKPEPIAFYQPIRNTINSHWPVDPTAEAQSRFIPPALKRRKIREVDENDARNPIASMHFQKTEDGIQEDSMAYFEADGRDSGSVDGLGSILRPPVVQISSMPRPHRHWSHGGQLELEECLESKLNLPLDRKEDYRLHRTFLPYIDGPGIDYHDDYTTDLGEEILEIMHRILSDPQKHARNADDGDSRTAANQLPRLLLDHRTAQLIVDDTIEFIDKLLHKSIQLAAHEGASEEEKSRSRSNAGSWMTVISAMQSMQTPPEIVEPTTQTMLSLVSPSEQLESLKQTIIAGRRQSVAAWKERRRKRREDAEARQREDSIKFFTKAKREKLLAGETLDDVQIEVKKPKRSKKVAAVAKSKTQSKSKKKDEDDEFEPSEEFSMHSDSGTPPSSKSSSSDDSEDESDQDSSSSDDDSEEESDQSGDDESRSR